MEVKKIVEGMTALQVAQVIDDNFKAQNKILEDDIKKQNNAIGVSEYKAFSESESVNVGDVRLYDGMLYECVEATSGAWDASKWKKSSFKAETEKKLTELGSEVDLLDSDLGVLSLGEFPSSYNYQKGITIDEDGKKAIDETKSLSEFIDLNGNLRFTVRITEGVSGKVVTYDEDKNYLGFFTIVSSRVITVENDRKYIRIVSGTEPIGNTSVEINGKSFWEAIKTERINIHSEFENVYKEVELNKKEIKKIDSVFVGEIYSSIEDGYLDKDNGIAIDSDDIFFNTDYIECKEGDVVDWFYNEPGNSNDNIVLATYYADKTFKGYFTGPNTGARNIMLGADTHYIRACYDKSYIENARLVINNQTVFKPLYVAGERKKIELCEKNAAKGVKDKFVKGYVDNSGKLNDDSMLFTTDFIPCVKGQYIDIESFADVPVIITTYDSDKNYLDYFMRNSRFVVEGVKCAYIRVVFALEKISSFWVKVDGILSWKSTSDSRNLEGIILGVPEGYSIASIESTSNIVITGKNQINKETLRSGYLINDSGIEVADSGSTKSSYYERLIPVHGIKSIRSNAVMQRVYLYDKDGIFLSRTALDENRIIYEIPEGVCFVRVQIRQSNESNFCVVYDGFNLSTQYSEYVEYSNVGDAKAPCFIHSDNFERINTIVYISNPYYTLDKPFNAWEPSSATDEYKCDLGYNNAYINLSYEDFIMQYFDKYIYKDYDEGYSVIKNTLGQDSGNSYYEMVYYEFKPKEYKYTVLISSGMNTCELAPIFGVGYFIKALMESAEDGMLALKHNVRFVVMPFICPTSFVQTPCKYLNMNDVRINKNFNYLKSWDVVSTDGRGTKGDYPDSEIESKNLKRWLGMYLNSDLYIDCHADLELPAPTRLYDVVVSNSELGSDIYHAASVIKEFYIEKGYISSDTITNDRIQYETDSVHRYPKTRYAEAVLGIPSIMVEQFATSTAYGGVADKQCDSYAIKNYVTQLRQYILTILGRRKK